MSDSPAQEWVLKQVQAHGLDPLLFALVIVGGAGFVAGCTLGWWLTQKKTRREIEKLTLENQKTSGEIVKDLAAHRDKFISERETLNLSLGEMREVLLAFKDGCKNALELRAYRDQMCSIYSNRYLPAITTYSESIAAQATRLEARVRAKTELIPGLKMTCSFLEMVNIEAMLAKCDSAAFKLRRDPRDGLFERVTALLPWWCLRLRWQVHKLKLRTDRHLRKED